MSRSKNEYFSIECKNCDQIFGHRVSIYASCPECCDTKRAKQKELEGRHQ